MLLGKIFRGKVTGELRNNISEKIERRIFWGKFKGEFVREN
jgi:hypothetical protein